MKMLSNAGEVYILKWKAGSLTGPGKPIGTKAACKTGPLWILKYFKLVKFYWSKLILTK